MKNRKILKHKKRQKRVRSKIVRQSDLMRMTVFRSNKHLYIQVIDDMKNHTLVSSSDNLYKNEKATSTEKAVKVGIDIADKLKAHKIKQVVFDRSGYRYGGRIKALVESVRKSGITI